MTEAEVLDTLLGQALSEVHVALPGRVESYDPASQTATVRPMVARLVDGPEGPVSEDLPAIQAVPVLWPRGGGFFVHLPLSSGDTVLLVIPCRDPSRWRRTGEAGAPPDHRAHSLAGAVAIPGYSTARRPIPSPGGAQAGAESGVRVTFGTGQVEVDGSSDAAALASKVDALIAAFNAHTHPSPGGPTSPPTAVPGQVPVTGSSASQVLKVGS